MPNYFKNLRVAVLMDALIGKTKEESMRVYKELSEKYIIEGRQVNDILSQGEGCPLKFFWDKQHYEPPPEINQTIKILFHHLAVDAYAKKHRVPRKVFKKRHVICRHEKHKFMACMPERGLYLDEYDTWIPVYIDVVDEVEYYIRLEEGLKMEYVNIANFALSVKKKMPYCVYIIYCPTLGVLKDWKITRTDSIVSEIENKCGEMIEFLKRGKFPQKNTGAHCLKCPYFMSCLRKGEPRTGELDEDLAPLVNRHFVAQSALERAKLAVSLLERKIDDKLSERESAHTSQFDIVRQSASKWKLDGERMAKEHPEIVRMFKVPFTEKKLIIKR